MHDICFSPKTKNRKDRSLQELPAKPGGTFRSKSFKRKNASIRRFCNAKPLKDAGMKVYEKKSSFVLSEMFSIELKFTIDISLKWFYNIYKSRFIELDMITKQQYEIENKIHWSHTKCVMCDFKLSVGSRFGPENDKLTYFDFVVKEEHLFLRNVYDEDVLQKSGQIKDLKTYYKTFKIFVNCTTLIDKYYTRKSDIYDIDHDCMEHILTRDLNEECKSFEDLYNLIDETKIKTSRFTKKGDLKWLRLRKRTPFVYIRIMKFPKAEFVEDTLILSNFLQNVTSIMYDQDVIHHSHTTGEIISRAHGFYNRKVRENKNNVSVIAHNFFGFDFFFLLKGIRQSI